MNPNTLSDADITHRLGSVTLSPHGPVVAGSTGQWTLTYTVGSYGLDEGATIKISQRFASDWEVPQFDRPDQPGYTSVVTDGAAKLRPYYHRKAHERPWMKCLVLDVYDGSLAPGDTITITLGDRSAGSPGIRAQTFQESAHEFRVLVDPTNASLVRRLPTSPLFPVLAGPPVRLICTVPTQCTVGEPVGIFVKGEDAWGNPTPAPTGVEFAWEGTGDAEWGNGQLTLRTPGSGYLRATAQTATGTLTCRSNPITALAQPPALRQFWGDLHAQSDATVGTGNEEEYFTFARDAAHLDFASHQGNDFQMTDADWQRLNDTVRTFHQDGRFVVFPGYEWSANTTAGGDRNVFFRQEGQPILRSSHWQIPNVPEDERTPAHPADVLFQRLREHVPLDDVLLGSHVGGRYADIRSYFDEELGPLVELVSCWGIFEWMLWDAFERGYIVGVMCNSDGHKGRPGAEGPGAGDFGISSGLTCVLAEALTRDAIFDALKARRCYGTTGPRMDLSFEIDGHPMGSVVGAREQAAVRAMVRGTAPLESLLLYRGKEVLETVQPAAFAECGNSERVRVSWRGSRIRGRARRVQWDGRIRVEGAQIVAAETVAFDSPADGILAQSASDVTFKSGTTGDTDGIDLTLSEADAGAIHFESEVGSHRVDLAQLTGAQRVHEIDCGGLDMAVRVERYPAQLTEHTLTLDTTVTPPAGDTTPYFVKAVQSDGHMAWASPIYISG